MSSKVEIKNKKAKFEYEFLESFTAGIQLFEDERALLANAELISQIAIGSDTKSHYFITKRGG